MKKQQELEKQLGLSIYTVNRDKFEFKANLHGFDFPCCACVHNFKPENCKECSKCDHNLNADKEQSK